MGMIVKNPSMMFIHIPKTGGESIREWIYTNLKNELIVTNKLAKHATQHEIEDVLSKENYNQQVRFKFCVVRNPWERLVSAYEYMNKYFIGSKDGKAFSVSFDDFIRRKHPFKEGPWGFLTLPQVSYFKSDCIVLRYENLAQEFDIVRNMVQSDMPLPHKNKLEYLDYKKYYTHDTANIVAKYCKADIDRFRYSFHY